MNGGLHGGKTIEIITYAEENGINIWIDGGWGVDALLEEETRAHNDIVCKKVLVKVY